MSLVSAFYFMMFATIALVCTEVFEIKKLDRQKEAILESVYRGAKRPF